MPHGNPPPASLGPDAFERPVFSATIQAHRSLGLPAFRTLMVLVAGVGAVTSLVFVSLGFWPIAGFFGLDVLALYIAFRVNFRRARAFEEVVVTRIEVLVARVNPRGRRREWRFNPLWTWLSKIEDEEYGLMSLAVTSRGERVAIAQEVSPAERARIALGLGRALGEVKRGY